MGIELNVGAKSSMMSLNSTGTLSEEELESEKLFVVLAAVFWEEGAVQVRLEAIEEVLKLCSV